MAGEHRLHQHHEDCSKYCSYCVVPDTSVEEVSGPYGDVLVDVAGLADQGVKEVTLPGQNVNTYRARMVNDAGAPSSKMMKLLDDVGFDNSFSFIFSPRPG